MGKRSRRWRKKQAKKVIAPPPTTTSPESLYRDGNYEGAIVLLRSRIEKEPTDQRKTLLAECLYRVKEYQESVNVIESIESKNSFHLRLAGICYYLLEDYANSITYLEKSLQLYEHPNSYYALALCQSQGQENYNLDAPTKNLVSDLLTKAISLPECPLEAFLWLEELQGYEDSDLAARADILERAIANYPQSEEARVRLARWYTYRLKNPQKALDLLQPSVNLNTLNPRVWMHAFLAAKETEDLESALKYLEGIQASYESSRVNLLLLKADTLLSLERLEESLTLYDEIVNGESVEAQISGLYGRAWIRITLNKDAALDDAHKATSLALNNKVYLSAYAPFNIEDDLYSYDAVKHIKNVSRHYIQKAGSGLNIDSELLGGLYYLLYEIELEDSEDLSEAHEGLLLNASQLSTHPKISRALSGYFAEQKKWSLAVTHHLKYSLWAHEQGFSIYLDTPFLNKVIDNEISIHKAERSKINKVVLRELKEHSDDKEAIRVAFEPFYRLFWRNNLLNLLRDKADQRKPDCPSIHSS